jgi:hypothetical protein
MYLQSWSKQLLLERIKKFDFDTMADMIKAKFIQKIYTYKIPNFSISGNKKEYAGNIHHIIIRVFNFVEIKIHLRTDTLNRFHEMLSHCGKKRGKSIH